MDELQRAIGNDQKGKILLEALKEEEKVAPGISGRLSVPLVSLIASLGKKPDVQNGVVGVDEDAGELSRISDTSSVVPRGKLDLVFTKESMVMKGKNIRAVVPYASISDIAMLEGVPHKKDKVYMIISMHRDTPVMNWKQKLPAVLLALDVESEISIPDPSSTNDKLSGNVAVVLFQGLTKMGVPISSMANSGKYKSAAGQAALSAVVRVNQGWIFPMPSAVCFVERPPMIIKHSDIKAIEPNRAGSGSSTFDLFIHTADGNMIQFQQIGSGELAPLMSYCEERKIKVGPPVEDTGDTKIDEDEGRGEGLLIDDEDDDDEDDLDFRSDASDSEEEYLDADLGSKRKRGAGGDSADDEYDDDDDDSDVELVSEDDITVAAFTKKILDEQEELRPRKSARRQGGGSGAGGSGQ